MEGGMDIQEYFDLKMFEENLMLGLKEGGVGSQAMSLVNEALRLTHLSAFIRNEVAAEELQKMEHPLNILRISLRLATDNGLREFEVGSWPLLRLGLVKLGLLYVTRFGLCKPAYSECGMFFVWGTLFDVSELMPDDLLKRCGTRWYELLLTKLQRLSKLETLASKPQSMAEECEGLYLTRNNAVGQSTKKKRIRRLHKLCQDMFSGGDELKDRIGSMHPEELHFRINHIGPKVDSEGLLDAVTVERRVKPVNPYSSNAKVLMESVAMNHKECRRLAKEVVLLGFQGPIEEAGRMLQIEDKVFSVDELVGKGSFGRVYRATRLGGGTVMLKCQNTSSAMSEFYILTQLKLRHSRTQQLPFPFPEVETLFYTGTSSVLVGRFYHEKTLFDYISTSPILPEATTANITCQLLNAVMFLHRAGILHNDIKSDNILVSSSNPPSIRLIDFGRAVDQHLLPSQADFTPSPQSSRREGVLRGSPHQQDFGLCWRRHEDYFHSASIIYFLLTGSSLIPPDCPPSHHPNLSFFRTKTFPIYTRHPIWDDILNLLINPDQSAMKALAIDTKLSGTTSCPYRAYFDSYIQETLASSVHHLHQIV
ncbi:hypothetical protein DSO57_1003383 [Entomophthora muscae]|uniref:Uncharacterized protein n=2 Tax=Entomophthora muscae TaxID=34485 RepID=A0ACC2SXE7_9FUNG|nr:hypothetical protein DSO57_1003374 [Entomophthora muscae]KAJ9067075.1 hypothetical protein DSO57_1003383 [Entomophthora muscae]